MKRGLLFGDDRDKSVGESALGGSQSEQGTVGLGGFALRPLTCQYSRLAARGQFRPSQAEKGGCSWLSEGGTQI